MDQSKINRINALSRLAKERALTPEEQVERQALRQEYLQTWRQSVQQTLDHTYIEDANGNRTKLKKKDQ